MVLYHMSDAIWPYKHVLSASLNKTFLPPLLIKLNVLPYICNYSRSQEPEGVCVCGGGTIYVPISTEGSGTQTMRPRTGYPVQSLGAEG